MAMLTLVLWFEMKSEGNLEFAWWGSKNWSRTVCELLEREKLSASGQGRKCKKPLIFCAFTWWRQISKRIFNRLLDLTTSTSRFQRQRQSHKSVIMGTSCSHIAIEFHLLPFSSGICHFAGVDGRGPASPRSQQQHSSHRNHISLLSSWLLEQHLLQPAPRSKRRRSVIPLYLVVRAQNWRYDFETFWNRPPWTYANTFHSGPRERVCNHFGSREQHRLTPHSVKDKAQHAVILDKATSDKLYKDVQSYRLITVATLVDRLKINGSLARRCLADLEEKGQIKKVVGHSKLTIYSTFPCLPGPLPNLNPIPRHPGIEDSTLERA